METGILNFTDELAIKRGTTKRFALTFLDGLENPIDLTNIGILARVSTEAGAVAVAQFTSSFIDAKNGVIQLILDTSQMLAGVYVWDLFFTLTNGDVVCPLQGLLEVMERTT